MHLLIFPCPGPGPLSHVANWASLLSKRAMALGALHNSVRGPGVLAADGIHCSPFAACKQVLSIICLLGAPLGSCASDLMR